MNHDMNRGMPFYVTIDKETYRKIFEMADKSQKTQQVVVKEAIDDHYDTFNSPKNPEWESNSDTPSELAVPTGITPVDEEPQRKKRGRPKKVS